MKTLNLKAGIVELRPMKKKYLRERCLFGSNLSREKEVDVRRVKRCVQEMRKWVIRHNMKQR